METGTMTMIIRQLVNGLSLGSIYALIALGYTMVYGIVKLINFAHGDILMVGSYCGFFIMSMLGTSPAALIAAFVFAMAFCALFAVFAYYGNCRFFNFTKRRAGFAFYRTEPPPIRASRTSDDCVRPRIGFQYTAFCDCIVGMFNAYTQLCNKSYEGRQSHARRVVRYARCKPHGNFCKQNHCIYFCTRSCACSGGRHFVCGIVSANRSGNGNYARS